MKTRYEKRLTQPVRYSGGIPQYSLGGILENTAAGAGMGAIGGSGVLSLPGALIGGGVGLITGVFDHFRQKKQEREQDRLNQQAANQSAAIALNAGGSVNNFMNPWSAGRGGLVQGGQPVKLRNKEMLLGPDGSTATSEQLGINTSQHTNKGVVTLEDGTVIVSPENSRQAKLIAARQKPEIDKLNKILDDPQSTILARKTAERRLSALKQEYLPLIQADAQKRMAEGGTPTGGDNIPQAGAGFLKDLGKFLGSDTGKQVLGGITSLAPVLYNTIKGTQSADYMNPASFQNPLAYNALATMRDRQPNINPALQATDIGAANAEANLRSSATGRGQYMSGRIGLADAAMGQKANIFAQGQQMRNQYLGEYGQMQANLGQGMAQTNLMVSDLNARNAAAQRNYGAAAVGQLSQWSQVQQQMSNQKSMDETVMKRYMDFMGLFNPTASHKATGNAYNLQPNQWANWYSPDFKIPQYKYHN